MKYVKFIGRRLVQSIPVVLGVTLVVFLLIHLIPGDPARTLLGPRATPEALAALNQQFGLDKSLLDQYLLSLERLASGSLGTSFSYNVPTVDLVKERLPVSLWLVGYSTVLTCLLALPMSLIAASGRGKTRDHLVRLGSVVGLGIPSFWLGILLIQFVAISTGLFPVGGFGKGVVGHLQSMFLPALTVAAGIAPLVIRSLRAEMLEVLTSEYVTTARAKGMPERQIRRAHVLRNSLLPAVTILAVNIGFFVGTLMIVETVFSLPGLGDLLIQAINRRDFTVVQGVTLLLALIVIAVNVIADIVQAFLDPRVELE